LQVHATITLPQTLSYNTPYYSAQSSPFNPYPIQWDFFANSNTQKEKKKILKATRRFNHLANWHSTDIANKKNQKYPQLSYNRLRSICPKPKKHKPKSAHNELYFPWFLLFTKSQISSCLPNLDFINHSIG
jgi:hypothetical protein